MIEHSHIPGTPTPSGPYTPAVRAGDFLFLSGQVAIDAETNEIVRGAEDVCEICPPGMPGQRASEPIPATITEEAI